MSPAHQIKIFYKTILSRFRLTIGRLIIQHSIPFLQQICEAAERYRDILAFNFYFPLQEFIDDQDPESDTMTTPTNISPATPQPGTGSTTQTSIPNNHNFHVDMIDLGDLTSLIRDQQEQDRASDSYENEIQTQEAAESNIFVYIG